MQIISLGHSCLLLSFQCIDKKETTRILIDPWLSDHATGDSMGRFPRLRFDLSGAFTDWTNISDGLVFAYNIRAMVDDGLRGYNARQLGLDFFHRLHLRRMDRARSSGIGIGQCHPACIDVSA